MRALPVIDPGYLAGLSVSILWTFTTLAFTAAGKRLGPTLVNAARIAAALILHAATHRLLNGHWVPDVRAWQVFCLGASGIIGLTIGDQAIIKAFLVIGPRRALLMTTTAPLMAALFGWLALDETLDAQAIGGILVTLAGVAWVIRERSGDGTANSSRAVAIGYVLALVAAACQAGGLMLSKQGMGHGWLPAEQHLAPQSATLIRMTFAAMGMIPLLAARALREREVPRDGDAVAHSRARVEGFVLACAGAVTGPFLGVWLSLFSANRVPIGIAQTLLSLTPIMILPVAHFWLRERVSARAVFGSVLAVGGLAILFLR